MNANFLLRLVAVVSLTGLIVFNTSANTEQTLRSIFDVMSHKEVLKLTLESDFETLRNNRREDDYQDAKVSFEDGNDQFVTYDLKIKIRGAFRRMNCSDIPPLKLNFKKSDLEAAGLAPFDDFKLVPQCVGDMQGESYLFKEYLAYKLYNELTEMSYRVQLLRITYKDTNTGKKSRQWAFLIEDTAELIDRVGGTDNAGDIYNIDPARFQKEMMNRVAVFQYMIGNADWHFSSMKNLKYILKGDQVIPIPYDFDFSGMVSAGYAAIDPTYGKATVRDRVYLGYPDQVDQLDSAIAELTEKKDRFEKIVRDFRYLSVEHKADLIDYLESYFKDPYSIKSAAAMPVRGAPESVKE